MERVMNCIRVPNRITLQLNCICDHTAKNKIRTSAISKKLPWSQAFLLEPVFMYVNDQKMTSDTYTLYPLFGPSPARQAVLHGLLHPSLTSLIHFSSKRHQSIRCVTFGPQASSSNSGASTCSTMKYEEFLDEWWMSASVPQRWHGSRRLRTYCSFWWSWPDWSLWWVSR